MIDSLLSLSHAEIRRSKHAAMHTKKQKLVEMVEKDARKNKENANKLATNSILVMGAI